MMKSFLSSVLICCLVTLPVAHSQTVAHDSSPENKLEYIEFDTRETQPSANAPGTSTFTTFKDQMCTRNAPFFKTLSATLARLSQPKGIEFTSPHPIQGNYQFITGLIQSLADDHHVCVSQTSLDQRAACLRKKLSSLSHKAFRCGKIDTIIAYRISELAGLITYDEQGKLVLADADSKKQATEHATDEKSIREIRKTAAQTHVAGDLEDLKKEMAQIEPIEKRITKAQKAEQKRRRKWVPELDAYVGKIHRLEALRKSKTGTSELDPENEKLLAKLYFRKEPGFGHVSPISFVLANYTADQIQALTEQFKSLIDFMNAKGAKIIVEFTSGKTEEIDLDHSDLYRLALKHMKLSLLEAGRSDGILAKTNPEMGDILTAAYLSGEVDAATFKIVLSLKELHENNVTPLKKFGMIMLNLSRMVLMAFPQTAVVSALVFTCIEAFKQKKEYEKATANKTHYF